jgi:hypothetical protein
MLYVTSLGTYCDIADKQSSEIISFDIPAILITTIRIHVTINKHTNNANAFTIEDVSIEKNTIPTQIIIGE